MPLPCGMPLAGERHHVQIDTDAGWTCFMLAERTGCNQLFRSSCMQNSIAVAMLSSKLHAVFRQPCVCRVRQQVLNNTQQGMS